MNYNLQGKAWEGASDLPEVNWRLGNPRIAKKGTPNGRAYMFAALFLLASSRMPTRTSPHRPISAPQSVQHAFPLRCRKCGSNRRVRLDRLRHDTASILVGRTTTGEEWLNGASLFLKRPLSSNFPCGSCLTVRLEPLLASCWGFERLDLCR